MSTPLSLQRSISPPPVRKVSRTTNSTSTPPKPTPDLVASIGPSLAAIEAGEATIRDHLGYFATHLEAACRPVLHNVPRLQIAEWRELYLRNQHSQGRHFVVHQHDHPVSGRIRLFFIHIRRYMLVLLNAFKDGGLVPLTDHRILVEGVHYDLRLQISQDSSISFAIPYGLPGNANSLRPMRMAIETRVHCLWNHLIESASHATGSLLIWDTGEYEVLQPQAMSKSEPETENELSDRSDSSSLAQAEKRLSDSEKLDQAFKRRHIRLRLHGTRLPEGYTIALRLPRVNDISGGPVKKPRYRRRKLANPVKPSNHDVETTDSDTELMTEDSVQDSKRRKVRRDLTGPGREELNEANEADIASGDEEDEMIRANNAYLGAHNTIGSVHQRRWFLSLDKQNSGFVKSARTGRWEHLVSADTDGESKSAGWDAFFVRGRDYERSVVTGRLAIDAMEDEGVKMYKGRKMWRPIME